MVSNIWDQTHLFFSFLFSIYFQFQFVFERFFEVSIVYDIHRQSWQYAMQWMVQWILLSSLDNALAVDVRAYDICILRFHISRHVFTLFLYCRLIFARITKERDNWKRRKQIDYLKRKRRFVMFECVNGDEKWTII